MFSIDDRKKFVIEVELNC